MRTADLDYEKSCRFDIYNYVYAGCRIIDPLVVSVVRNIAYIQSILIAKVSMSLKEKKTYLTASKNQR
jgi:hypothetical protein